MKKSEQSKLTLLVILLAIVAGSLSGVIAAVVSTQSLEEYARSLTNGERLFAISEPRPQPLPGTYEEALAQVQETGFAASALIRPTSVDSTNASQWVTRDSATGFGSVVTSDGWVLFHKDA